MRAQQLFVLMVVLGAGVATSGCLASAETAKDWLGNNGSIIVQFGTLPASAPGQRVQEFSTVKVALTAVTVYTVNEVRPYAGVIYNPPLGLDLRTRMDDGEAKTILKREHIPTKTVSKVEVKLILVEAKDNAGNLVPPCPFDKPAERKPCVAMPKAGAFVLDKEHDPPRMQRAKTMTLTIPIVVIYNEKAQEYFLQSRSADEESPVTFA